MLNLPYRIILGSQSPRRKELLNGIDIPFEVRTLPNVEEDYPIDLPLHEIPRYLSAQKARYYIPTLANDELLITADTVVLVKNEVLGKPLSKAEAEEMLKKLSGECHTVITGVSFSRPSGIKHMLQASSKVYFAPLTNDEISYYLERYRPYDKAGSYGIQEWIGYVAIQRIEGSFYNVMGLPIHLIYHVLKNWNLYESC